MYEERYNDLMQEKISKSQDSDFMKFKKEIMP